MGHESVSEATEAEIYFADVGEKACKRRRTSSEMGGVKNVPEVYSNSRSIFWDHFPHFPGCARRWRIDMFSF